MCSRPTAVGVDSGMGSETGAAEGGVVGGRSVHDVDRVLRRVGKYEWTHFGSRNKFPPPWLYYDEATAR